MGTLETAGCVGEQNRAPRSLTTENIFDKEAVRLIMNTSKSLRTLRIGRPATALAVAGLSTMLGMSAVEAQSSSGNALLKSHRIAVGAPVRVTVLQGVSSDSAQVGDHVRVRVASDDTSGLPSGTVFVGRVTRATPASNKRPGELEVQFGLPSQDEAGLSAGDNPQSVAFTDAASAHLVGKASTSDKSNYTGIGAGAGAVLGLSRHRRLGDAIEGAILGGAAGYGANQLQKHPGTDVSMAKGSEATIHLDTPLTLRTEIVAPY